MHFASHMQDGSEGMSHVVDFAGGMFLAEHATATIISLEHSFGSHQPFTIHKIGDFLHLLLALSSNNQFIIISA